MPPESTGFVFPSGNLKTDVEGGIVTESLSPATRPIRLGIIGTGLAVKKLHWPALARMSDRFVVAAFANRTRSTAEEFATFAHLSMDDYSPDYHDLLRRDDLEAVLVCVPIPRL